MEGTDNIILGLLGIAAGLILLVLLIALIIFIVVGIFLNKFHKRLYGKGSVCAWIPFAQTYLLGKLAFNKTVGWILVALTIFTMNVTTTVNGVTTNRGSLIPGGQGILSIIVIGLLIYAIIKYNKIKKGEINVEEAAALSNSFSFSKQNLKQNTNNVVTESTTTSSSNTETSIPTPNQEATYTKKCSNCGAQITEDNQFCPNCGTQL